MDDENGESMEPVGEEPLVGLVESELERLVHGCRRGSRILQGRVSNPSERGTAPPPQLF